MKSHFSNGTILHCEITFILLHFLVIIGGNSLCSLFGGLMACVCGRVILILHLTKIILNIKTHITCLTVFSIPPFHLLFFVVVLIFLKALYWIYGFLLFASCSFLTQLVFGRWPFHSTCELNHLADKRQRLLVSNWNHWTYKTNQNQRNNKNKSIVVDLNINH